ncbi:Uncharacterised protein (plasmid) [Legionella adelaidensis]|uniref:Uncharacterized protein n=1 Tax=Legionella adelaidensis TaxID=45056 RepID=A0A3S4WHF8_9GAMM|nr:hypothetical protein [Legionella adelaidensis]VEH85408.1 Uncharacterised protein [Legionella adelaidensis]
MPYSSKNEKKKNSIPNDDSSNPGNKYQEKNQKPKNIEKPGLKEKK